MSADNKRPWASTNGEELTEYITKDGGTLYALADNRPVGDGYFSNPATRYMGLADRPAGRSCGSCMMAGMCQFCANRWPTPIKK